MAINMVDDLSLSRPPGAPDAIVIRARGMAPSGWTNPALEQMPDTIGDVRVVTFKFVALLATTPVGSDVLPMTAELRLDALPKAVTKIRVISAMNEMSMPVPGTS